MRESFDILGMADRFKEISTDESGVVAHRLDTPDVNASTTVSGHYYGLSVLGFSCNFFRIRNSATTVQDTGLLSKIKNFTSQRSGPRFFRVNRDLKVYSA